MFKKDSKLYLKVREQMDCEFANQYLKCMFSNIKKAMRKKKGIYICWRSNTKISEKDVWFESKAIGMIVIRKLSDLNQKEKTIWNPLVWFETQDLWFESHY